MQTHEVYKSSLDELLTVKPEDTCHRFYFIKRRDGSAKMKAYHLDEEIKNGDMLSFLDEKIRLLLEKAGITNQNLKKWYNEHGNFMCEHSQELDILLLPTGKWYSNAQAGANQLSIF